MKNKFSILSISISAINLLLIVKINYDLYEMYLNSDGKTRALFWIKELLYNWKYYLIFLSILAIIFSIVSIKKSENQNLKLFSLIFAIVTIPLIILRPWYIFV